MADTDLAPSALGICDREPIHIPGRIQSFGCLIATDATGVVIRASANTAEIIARPPESLLGRPLAEVLPRTLVHDLRTRLQILSPDLPTGRLYAVDILGTGALHDVSVHRSDGLTVIEIEPKPDTPPRDDMALIQPLIARIRRHDTVEAAAQEGVMALQALTGLDRVMVYRFETDGSGTVIAEAAAPGQAPYLGLRYPASDIPRQARALYLRSPLRLIADVAAPTIPILATRVPTGLPETPLDLSLAVTRAVAPVHLEYLRNMEVAASMSAAIICRDQLWGLFACHHGSAFRPDYQQRSAIELFVQLFNYELARIETDAEFRHLDRARTLHDRIMSRLSGGADLAGLFDPLRAALADVISFDGIALVIGGREMTAGDIPERAVLDALRPALDTGGDRVLATDCLTELLPPGAAAPAGVAGLLALPLSREPGDTLMLFRRELVRDVTWAGDPAKPEPVGTRISPRRSFAAWQGQMRGRSSAWQSGEIRAAEALRVTLLEVVLKLTEEANRNRRRAQEQQELLIAELNHRVRNILNLIRGLVSQGRDDATTVEEYSHVLDDRIHALARAHDQLTRRSGDWVPLRTLVRNEIAAYLRGSADRVRLRGAPVDLSPAAFTTVALVLHELVTNSAKYGALSTGTGHVDIAIRLDDETGLHLDWTERGGPPVTPPERRGFGTTIIERSIPYDLKGSADIRYAPEGLEARFTLPGEHVRRRRGGRVESFRPEAVADAAQLAFPGPVLVVDDNLIITLDTADMLHHLGATQVETAGTVQDAAEQLETGIFRLAVLDMNLGDELSLPLAEMCRARGIPFLIATGYESAQESMPDFPPAPRLQKPFTRDQLAAILSTMGLSGAG